MLVPNGIANQTPQLETRSKAKVIFEEEDLDIFDTGKSNDKFSPRKSNKTSSPLRKSQTRRASMLSGKLNLAKQKTRFMSKLKLMNKDNKSAADKHREMMMIKQQKKDAKQSLVKVDAKRDVIESFFGFDYKYETDTDDENKYLTKFNRNFQKLR